MFSGQARLGLPTRDYYLLKGDKYDSIRTAYRNYIIQLGKLAGLSNHSAITVAYLQAPSNKVVELLKVAVTNETNATNFQMGGVIARITTLGAPANFTNTPPVKHEAGDQ